MKKLIALTLVLFIVCSFLPSYASAYGNGDPDSALDRVSDWFATIGKSPEEKDMIIAERRADRAAQRLKKAFNKETKKAEKGMKEFGKDMERAFK